MTDIDTNAEVRFSTNDVVRITGATYRQLDHWTSKGYLKPDNAKEGSGFYRHWAAEEIRCVVVMLALKKLRGRTGSIADAVPVLEAVRSAPTGRWLVVGIDGVSFTANKRDLVGFIETLGSAIVVPLPVLDDVVPSA